eukprot:TRINITY_DN80_c0_g4_i2.p1 TRINITY_DN80_c0_g4~~TRINITY_DN80_c0_g4_i2.p1  ORF type:complete len:232 (-),score=45.86 TRINITY_DN80_c0_g4_i2:33-728(-)
MLALVLFNNPFYLLEFFAPGQGKSFFGAFVELVFVTILYTSWFFILNMLRSEDELIEWNVYLKMEMGLLGVYVLLTSTLYAWSISKAQVSSLFHFHWRLDGIQVLYYLSSLVLLAISIMLGVIMLLTLLTIREKNERKMKFYFFSIPTTFGMVSVVFGIFFGTIGPIGRNTPSFVYFFTFYNLYTYLLVWGYWPVNNNQILGGKNPSEATKIFEGSEEFDQIKSQVDEKIN